MVIDLGKIRKIIGLITDFLTFGRASGWWNKTNSIPGSKDTLNTPK